MESKKSLTKQMKIIQLTSSNYITFNCPAPPPEMKNGHSFPISAIVAIPILSRW